jgi:eukaryotic-like serine/threonine-protein kinase
MSALASGDRFAGYLVDEALGHGGYATVYRARQPGARAVVALKVLDDNHLDPVHLARLRREFAFARQLDHPHVVTMYDAGPGWLAMELVAGGTIGTPSRRTDRLTALAQIADALDYAHRRGIVHCDVKPSNILVAQELSPIRAVLVDFGVAHSVAADVGRRPSHVEASLPYSAPELLRGQAPSAATDEYALACTTVELITGAPPFSATTPMDLIEAHLHRPPPRISKRIAWVPLAFDAIVAKGLAKSPDHRYRTCAEFVSLISRALR